MALTVLIADQASKLWAVSALSDGRHMAVLSPLLELRLVYNAGAAFSFGETMTWVFAVTAAVAVFGILYAGRRLGSGGWALALGMMLGGATSHLGDRLFRAPGFAQGHVVDFIDYNGLFVGNVADIALTAGAAVIMLLALRGVPPGGHADDRPPSGK
ncbi:signal peptidase II [Actinomadura alba]|uniref:signal peptidase II n=1 Tax=Actinomadura alba TaxID=406431 RepID=UPI001C9CAABF|nr:signal peptidase II [Actinomadura alba]